MATAEVKILIEGYYYKDSDGRERTCPTISLVRDLPAQADKNIKMVVDPGILEDQKLLLDALAKEGLSAEDINFVCLTHSHIDHYKNASMFPNAKILEYFGIWQGNTVEDWDERFSENIQILETPGHDRTCITLFVKTKEGVVAVCGDVFWKEGYPEIDIYASDLKKLKNSRKLVLEMADWIVPGHGPMYENKKSQSSKNENGKKTGQSAKISGRCKYCKRPFLNEKEKCICQNWLCYRCCECEDDCPVCKCSRMR